MPFSLNERIPFQFIRIWSGINKLLRENNTIYKSSPKQIYFYFIYVTNNL